MFKEASCFVRFLQASGVLSFKLVTPYSRLNFGKDPRGEPAHGVDPVRPETSEVAEVRDVDPRGGVRVQGGEMVPSLC